MSLIYRKRCSGELPQAPERFRSPAAWRNGLLFGILLAIFGCGGGDSSSNTDEDTPDTPPPAYVEACSADSQCQARGPGFICNASDVCEYQPPLGIPKPPFGIEESYRYYDRPENRNPALTYYENSEGGYYTHYIDNTDPDCSDESEFGTEALPRCSIPGVVWTLPAGSVAEIHGGPYVYQRQFWDVNGTAQYPVFIRGFDAINRIQLTANGETGNLYLQGTYGIVENLELFHGKALSLAQNTGDARSRPGSYLSARNMEIHNPSGYTGAGGVNLNLGETYKVAYNNHVHHNVRGGGADGGTIDSHGLHSNSGGRYHWILNNEINHNSGDGYQACHGCTEDPPRYIYIGGNDFHDDYENAVDLKYIEDVVVSQNTMHSYAHTSDTGTVSPVVIGSDGASTRPWIIFNEIYDSLYGIRVEEGLEVVILGNVMHDLTGPGINLEKLGENLVVLGNSFIDVEVGISQQWRTTFSLLVYNNIFDGSGDLTLAFESPEVIGDSLFRNNLFWRDGDPINLEWGSHISLPDTDALSALLPDQDNLIEDPLLINGFALDPDSPAIGGARYDAAVEAVFDRYQGTFDIDIRRDFNGAQRPQGGTWDIGAVEYVP